MQISRPTPSPPGPLPEASERGSALQVVGFYAHSCTYMRFFLNFFIASPFPNALGKGRGWGRKPVISSAPNSGSIPVNCGRVTRRRDVEYQENRYCGRPQSWRSQICAPPSLARWTPLPLKWVAVWKRASQGSPLRIVTGNETSRPQSYAIARACTAASSSSCPRPCCCRCCPSSHRKIGSRARRRWLNPSPD